MMLLFQWFLICYGATLITWVFYLAVMNLSENRDEISWPVKVFFAWPVAFVGYCSDVLFALLASLFALLLADLPRELLFTSKMNRWQEGSGVKCAIADWFCREMLNKFAPNNHHCRRSS